MGLISNNQGKIIKPKLGEIVSIFRSSILFGLAGDGLHPYDWTGKVRRVWRARMRM